MDDKDNAAEKALESAVHQLATACVLAWARSRVSAGTFNWDLTLPAAFALWESLLLPQHTANPYLPIAATTAAASTLITKDLAVGVHVELDLGDPALHMDVYRSTHERLAQTFQDGQPLESLAEGSRAKASRAWEDAENKLIDELVPRVVPVIWKRIREWRLLLESCPNPAARALLIGLVAWSYRAQVLNGGMVDVYRAIDDELDHELGPVPFVCPFSDVAILLDEDATQHDTDAQERAIHTAKLARELTSRGWAVLRFHHHEVMRDLRGCIEAIDLFMAEDWGW